MSMDNPRIAQLISEEVQRIPGEKKVNKPGQISICCPFHDDKNPSGTINISGTRVPPGFFRCWSCGHKASWNVLAAKLGLRTITGKIAKKQTAAEYIGSSTRRSELLGEEDDEQAMSVGLSRTLKSLHEKTWPFEEWRGYKVTLLKKVGAKYVWDSFAKEHFVTFPVYIKGELEGLVRARIKKPANKEPSYLNSPGRWSEKKGLIFFDYAVALMEKQGHRNLVLVEGPRDALRLLRNNIPAMAVLGALNWNQHKSFTFEQAEVENVLLMFDGDAAGEKATRHIYPQLKGRVNCRYMALWKVPGEYDPGNCPTKFIKIAKKFVQQRG